LIDTELAGYRVAEEIGRGGMAIVYRAYQARLERWVAIKVLRAGLLADKEALVRFRREAKAVAALRHPNILTVYDYGEDEGRAYIVMEYVAGGTLKSHQNRQPWAWPQAVSLLIPVGQALAYAHTQGIVHRDVKPANILLPRDDWPLLSDFGLAKLLETQQHLTRPGVGLGTPLYTAPEQMMSARVDHRADIYALGLILYEMVTGRLPFDSDSLVQMMVGRLNRPPLPPRQVNPAVPPQLEEILLKALARHPADRFGDMGELVDALNELRHAASQSVATDATRITQVIRRDQLVLGPRLRIAGTGVPLLLPPKGEILIGRGDPYSGKAPDIDLSAHGGVQAGVSRIHARILHRGDRWYLEDLNSTNGTIVNERQVRSGRPVELKDGDVIQFGNMRATFYGS
jgi:serine/threonine protein kinase